MRGLSPHFGKTAGDSSWINGSFFVLESGFDYLEEMKQYSKDPLERLSSEGQLVAYKHADFWYTMDTLRDKNHLETLWQSVSAVENRK
jgi:glucose-1-phosphate cytidylyltransferase